MKRKVVLIALVMSIMLILSPTVRTYASLEIKHVHQVCSRDGGYELIRLYSHSHYCTRNGRDDWWPCVVYDKYRRTERYCVECGLVIESLCYRDYIGQVHELAY